MASENTSSIKIHEQCNVAPTPPSTHVSLPLTFFDVFWLRFHPVERVFFYTLRSPPSLFFDQFLPKLKTSLSLTLHHFLPLAGIVVWPSDSDVPFVQYNPGDGVSLVVAESDADFNAISNNSSPREALESHSFLPRLESSNSHASVMSIQITLFPSSGFSIGISAHHAVLDGKSTTMFIKAWASLCQSSEDSPALVPELKPFLDRTVIKDPKDVGLPFMSNMAQMMAKMFPDENSDGRRLKILPFEPNLEDSVRATFELTRADLEKVKKKVLSKWDKVDNNGEESMIQQPPTTLSTFVLTCSYVLNCIAKAVQGVENERQKFSLAFTVDCRSRLEPPIPDNYFGNCVWGLLTDAESKEFLNEDGVVLVAKRIYNRIKNLEDKGVFYGAGATFAKYGALASEGVEIMGVAGSNRFGVYGIDFGWGKPTKVEITSVDRTLSIAIAENKDSSKGGVEVGLVLNKHAMDLFTTLFQAGLCDE